MALALVTAITDSDDIATSSSRNMIPTFRAATGANGDPVLRERAIIVAEKSLALLASRISTSSVMRSGRIIASTILTRR
jgi:hypothetical protein